MTVTAPDRKASWSERLLSHLIFTNFDMVLNLCFKAIARHLRWPPGSHKNKRLGSETWGLQFLPISPSS